MNRVVGNTLPDGWEEKKLGEVLDNILTGTTPSKREPKYYENPTVNWFSPSDFGVVKVLEDAKNKVSQLAIDERKAKLYEEDSLLLVAIGATVGKVAIARKKVSSNQQITALKFMPHIDVDFAYHYFIFIKPMVVKTASAATMPIINQKAIKSLTIPLPPLEEQKRIVAKIDALFAKIDKAISLTEKSLKQAKNLLPSVLKEVFEGGKEDGWKYEKLGVLGKLTSSKRIYKKEYVTRGIPFYRSKEIKELSHNRKISVELFISEQRYTEIKNKFGTPKEGDILLTAVGTIGEMYIVKENEKFYFKDGNIMWLKDFSNLSPYYLKYALTNFVEILKTLSQGSAYQALTIEKLKKYSIPIPALKEQEKIVANLDRISNQTIKTQSKLEEQLAYLKQLKSSILSKAFQGVL